MDITMRKKSIIYFGRREYADLTLVCFPYAGGSAAVFYDWTQYLPPNINLCAVQYPGRASRFFEAPIESVSELVSSLESDFDSLVDGPFALFGHSMGALVAFELARSLRRNRREGPQHLFISGRTAPQIMSSKENLHTLSEGELLNKLEEFNGTPRELLENPEVMSLVLNTLRADFKACETYSYQEEVPLSCPISAYGGLSDPDICREDIKSWNEMTSTCFNYSFFTGDHFFLNQSRSSLISVVVSALNS